MIRLGVFVLFLLLGALVALTARTRFSALVERIFIAYVAVVALSAGLMTRDLWPFSAYPFIPESSEGWRQATWYELRAVDARGRELEIDPDAWSPLSRSTMHKWVERTFFPKLDDRQRRRIADWMLQRANTRDCPRVFGPLNAPDWMLAPGGTQRDGQRAVALRIYKHAVGSRTLAYEYRR